MRNTVAKKLRKVTAGLNRNKAWYRQLKRHWNMIPPAERHEAIERWMNLYG